MVAVNLQIIYFGAFGSFYLNLVFFTIFGWAF